MANNKDIYKINKDLLFKLLEKMKMVVYTTVIVQFWVNQIESDHLKIANEIVDMLNKVFIRDLSSELERLAKIQSVTINSEFMSNLETVYGAAILTEFGFTLTRKTIQTSLQQDLQPN